MTDKAMHVEAFGRVLTDAGSIPAASTITSFNNFLRCLKSPFKKGFSRYKPSS